MRSVLAALLLVPVIATADDGFVRVPQGTLVSVLKYEDNLAPQNIDSFEIMRAPVTNAQFLAFVRTHPQWQRGQISPVFAEPGRYLSHWQGPLQLGPGVLPEQPVVQVSWFAANAYCEAIGARLPVWNEWEYVAAADTLRRDARQDPAWREGVLAWYSSPSNQPLAAVAQRPANVYGVYDSHGLVWEWTQDFSAMLVSSDNRTQSDPDKAQFCGAGALSIKDKEDYAVMMRVAMLSSLQAVNSTANLGFRCAR